MAEREPRGAELYGLLRHLTLPIVALTTSAEGRSNGMIANSAQRASLVPSLPRVSLYVSKSNLSHEMVYRSGVFALHLLRRDQWDVVRALGLASGRDVDKLARFATTQGESGAPLLEDVFAAFDCRVVNAMDAGAATFFLADVVAARDGGEGEVMTSDFFRANAPADVRLAYEQRLEEAQRRQAELAGRIEQRLWPGPTVRP